MLSTQMLTKKETIELIEQHFADVRETERISCLVTYNTHCGESPQQVLLFNREIEGFRN